MRQNCPRARSSFKSANDSDVTEACARELRPVEKLSTVKQRRGAHFSRQRRPRQIAILRPLRHHDKGIRASGDLLRFVAEYYLGIPVFAPGTGKSNRIVGSDFGTAFDEVPGDFDGRRISKIVSVRFEGKPKEADGAALRQARLPAP